MRIDLAELRRHYASLSDGELNALDRSELTEEAVPLFDEELARRKLTEGQAGENLCEPDDGATALDQPGEIREGGEFDIFLDDAGPPPDWLEDAAYACGFVNAAGTFGVARAAKARAVLRAAGIPCYITLTQEDPPKADLPPPFVNVMVPGALGLQATSILDRDIFNEEEEAAWRTHLKALSDSDLSALKPEIFCAGLLDRVARLTRAYEDEIARRQLKPRAASHP